MVVSKFRMFRKILRLWIWSIIKRGWYLPEISEITVDELFDRFNAKTPPILLDLRDLVEFYGNGEYKYEKYGHIPNSKWIRLMELSSHLEDLKDFKEKEVVTICQGGGMSLVAVQIMGEAGFNNVKSLKGGIKGWHRKGYPLIKSNEEELPLEEIKLGFFNGGSKIFEKELPLDEKYSGEIHYSVDARGLSCPQPILKSVKALKTLEIDQVLEILTTDPGSRTDIPAWARSTGQEFLGFEEHNLEEFRFLVKKMK